MSKTKLFFICIGNRDRRSPTAEDLFRHSKDYTARSAGVSCFAVQRVSVPTPDHYLPLLYVIGAHHSREAVTFPVEGVDGGSISMLAVRVG
jgi:protein-tyrosine-phosphatase